MPYSERVVAGARSSVLFIGKRFYTNRDALTERYGRIYQLPHLWAEDGVPTRLWLVDYKTRETRHTRDGALDVTSLPAIGLGSARQLLTEAFGANAARPDVVVASADCYIGLVGYRLARRLGARFVFDVYDKYDEFSTYRRLPGFDPFTFLLQRADSRLFASRSLVETIGMRPSGDVIVPNGVDTTRFRPLDRLEARRSVGLPEDIPLVGYFGAMDPDRGVADLIEAVQRVRQGGIPIELLLGGRGHKDVSVNHPGVRHLGNVPFDRMPKLLASCDLLSIPYQRSTFMDAGASNKIAEAIACGRPIVATQTPNLIANFPEQAKKLEGLLANPSDPDDLARVIRLQLQRRVTVELPATMTWQSIARSTREELAL